MFSLDVPRICAFLLAALLIQGAAAADESGVKEASFSLLREIKVTKVHSLAFSGDGRTLVTASTDEMLLWDVATRRVRQVLPGVVSSEWAVSERGDEVLLIVHANLILKRSTLQGTLKTDNHLDVEGGYSMTLSDDGKFAACYRLESPGRYYLETYGLSPGRTLKRVFLPKEEPWEVMLSADGSRVAFFGMGGSQKSLHVFDTSSGTRMHQIDLGRRRWACGQFSHDKQQIYFLGSSGVTGKAGYEGKAVVEIDLSRNKLRELLVDQPYAVDDLKTGNHLHRFHVSNDRKWLASQYGNRLQLWSLETGKSAARTFESGDRCPPRFSPDSKWLAIGVGAGARLYSLDNLATWEHVDLGRRPGEVKALSFDAQAERLAAVRGNQLEVWELKGKYSPKVLAPSGAALPSVAIHPNGTQVAAGAADGTVYHWPNLDKPPRKLSGHERPVKAVAFAPDGTQLLSGDLGGVVRAWDEKDGAERAMVKAGGGVTTFAFRPHANIVAVANLENEIELWRTSDWKLDTTLKGHIGPVTAMGFHADGSLLASASQDYTAIVWDLARNSALDQFPAGGSPTYIAFAKPADSLLLAGAGLGIWQYNWRSKQKQPEILGAVGELRAPLALHPRGRVAIGIGETIKFWNGSSGDVLSPK